MSLSIFMSTQFMKYSNVSEGGIKGAWVGRYFTFLPKVHQKTSHNYFNVG